MYGAFPDLHVELRSLFAEETVAAAEYGLMDVHLGDLDNVLPTGGSFRVKALAVYAYNGHRFTGQRFHWDCASMLQQLGI